MARNLEQIRWSLELACSEFDIHRATLTKRLKANSEEAGSDGKFSTAQIYKAIAGDRETEMIAKIVAERKLIELKTAELEGSLIPTNIVCTLAERMVIPIRQKICAAQSLSEVERHDLLTDLVQLGEMDWAGEVRAAMQ